MSTASTPNGRRYHDRVGNACDLCKKRKVKCDGSQPCAYCTRRARSDTCTYSAHRSRKLTPAARTPRASADQRSDVHGPRQSLSIVEDDHTSVPLEAGLLRDSEGKSIFIGDSAPLSFLQTVRQLLKSKVDPYAFPHQSTRDSIIEHAPVATSPNARDLRPIDSRELKTIVETYLVSTSGLIGLFDERRLVDDALVQIAGQVRSEDERSTLYHLVAAIGLQDADSTRAETYFIRAKEDMLSKYCGSMSVAVIQGLILMTVYLLRAAQPNLAFLYFGLAARTAYAIGIHRTEVNAHFGEDKHKQRDRTWKSLRIVDLFLSTSLGRPPAVSDVDCTVSYGLDDEMPSQNVEEQLLDASVQAFLIIETVIVSVYSQKKISLRLATEVSQQLKKWASRWLGPLSQLIKRPLEPDKTLYEHQRILTGACQVLCSYYYSVMLLTRPFLVYNLHEYLSTSRPTLALSPKLQSEKANFAYAALDAAILFVDLVHGLVVEGYLEGKMPIIVSWLLTTALVLSIAVLGPSGRMYQAHALRSIECLHHFASSDLNARQHSTTAQSLLETILKYVEKAEMRDRSKRSQMSSFLFGLPSLDAMAGPTTRPAEPRSPEIQDQTMPLAVDNVGNLSDLDSNAVDWAGLDTDFFALPWAVQDSTENNHRGISANVLSPVMWSDLPLFPITGDAADTRPLSGLDFMGPGI